jgi:hypothetical protein
MTLNIFLKSLIKFDSCGIFGFLREPVQIFSAVVASVHASDIQMLAFAKDLSRTASAKSFSRNTMSFIAEAEFSRHCSYEGGMKACPSFKSEMKAWVPFARKDEALVNE